MTTHTSWSEFAVQDPALAAHAAARLTHAVAYLGTLTRDGSPRVHPVSPIITTTELYLFMEPTSVKIRDLARDPRYALHAGVEDDEGGGGELSIRGRAHRVDDPATWASVATSDTPERRLLYAFGIERVLAKSYTAEGSVFRHWPNR